MDYVLIIALIMVTFLNFIGNVWAVKQENKEQRIHATQIYKLYNELKRFNDNWLDNRDWKD
ncbi:MAG: hypothetical protein HFH60_02720 [Lachnospiraceae bacterium]|nr:hypothetical protein [Lachnospiraceae bacterium]